MAETVASKNRRQRQEQLREQLSQGGHVQHVVEIAEKLQELGGELSTTDVQRLKAAADIKLKLISKYIPDLKATELTGEGGEPINAIASVVFKPVGKDD